MSKFETVASEDVSPVQHLLQEWRRALGSEDHGQHYSDNNKVHIFAGTNDRRAFTYFYVRTKTHSSTNHIRVQQYML